MNSFHAFTCAALTAFANLLAPAAAQDLTADVVQDPAAGTVTYTLDIAGPRSGLCFPFVSFFQGPQVQIPGVFGSLMLDQHLIAPLPMLFLDPLGQGQAQLVAPAPLANGVPLFFQALLIDQRNNLAIPPMAAAAPFAAPAAPTAPARPAFICGSSYRAATQTCTVEFTLGPPNGQVTVLIAGGQVAQGFLVLDANGRGEVQVPVPGGMQPGQTVTVLLDAQPVASYRH